MKKIMSTENKICPFCGTEAKVIQKHGTLQSIFCDCLCGEFITGLKKQKDVG